MLDSQRGRSWGNMNPDYYAFTVFWLELVIHIPPPLGIPLSCVLGFANDASAAGAPAFVVASPENRAIPAPGVHGSSSRLTWALLQHIKLASVTLV